MSIPSWGLVYKSVRDLSISAAMLPNSIRKGYYSILEHVKFDSDSLLLAQVKLFESQGSANGDRHISLFLAKATVRMQLSLVDE